MEFITLLSEIDLFQTKYLEITRIKDDFQIATMFSRYLQTIACFIRSTIIYLYSEIKVIFLKLKS